MAFPDNCTITDGTILTGFIQNAYLRGNPADAWYFQDGIIPCELPGGANDWGLLLNGSAKFGVGAGPSDAQCSISTNGLGAYSFMTATRVSSTGAITLYNGTGSGSAFTLATGSKNGTTPSYMGYNQPGNMQYMNADMASLFWFDDVKSGTFISSVASTFTTQKVPNLDVAGNGVIQFWSRPIVPTLFSNLSTQARTAAFGAYALKSVALNASSSLAINVRNGSTSATSDFYADTNGNLTTGINGSGQTISSWLGGATGYITTWYDQSGGSNNATQVTQASQPIIDYTNKWIDFKPSAYFNLPNGTIPYINSNYTMSSRHNTINNNQACILGSGAYGTVNGVNSLEKNASNYVQYWWGNDLSIGTYATGNKVTFKYDNTVGRTGYINGSSIGTNSSTTRNSTNLYNTIACDWRSGSAGVFLNGELYYVNLFNIALSDTDRIFVENQ